MEENKQYKVVIIGSGPAGLTAAIYAARAMLKPLVIDGMQPGGQLTITSEVENYPGFPEGIDGPKLMADTRQQAERFGTEFMFDVVEDVDFSKRPFSIKLSGGEVLAETLIISSGASANWLGLESEKKLQGRGVSACATCDGFFFKDKDVVVIGGGDSAMEEATFLTKFASKVMIIHRRDELRASKIMQEKALNNPKIEVIWDSTIEEVLDVEKNEVTGVRIKNVKTGQVSVIDCQGFFLGIGHTPNTQLFKGKLEMDDTGYLITKGKSTYTSVPGVFAAGDVQDSVYRQAISAAGTGCMAAIDAERFLEAQE